MQNTAVVAVFLCTTLNIAVSQTSINYCGSKMCGHTDDHTFCQFPEGPGPQCVGYISAELSDDEKERVISRLNRRRDEAAAGRLKGLASAGNMLKLRWVEELAREAQRWADQCRPPVVPEERDTCRDLYSVTVGQCIASVVGEAPGLRIETMVDIWYMQNILYKGNATSYIPPNANTNFYGDFGQMMWAQSYMVGCGRSRFMTEWRGRLRSVERLVCNIAPSGPPPGRPLWSPSAPATLCPTHTSQDATFHGLCDIQIDFHDIHEVDASMTLEEHFLLYTVLEIERNESLRYPGSLDELYLTKIAIATMENVGTPEESYNSMQKRDLVGKGAVENANITITVTQSLEVTPFNNNTSYSMIPLPNMSMKKKKNFIGRPKSYKMEDLTDMELMTENYSPSEETTKKGKDFYAEYEFVEAMEENSTVRNNEDAVILADTAESIKTMYYFDNRTRQEAIPAVNSEVSAYIAQTQEAPREMYEGLTNQISLSTENTNFYHNPAMIINDGQMPATVTNESLGPDNSLNYLSDQETVQELQAALEVMERDNMAMESTTIEAIEKVRRDLKEEEPTASRQMREEHKRSPNLDKNTMYNMVLQYMPYLKDYQSSLLSKASRARRPDPPLVLDVFVFIVLCVSVF